MIKVLCEGKEVADMSGGNGRITYFTPNKGDIIEIGEEIYVVLNKHYRLSQSNHPMSRDVVITINVKIQEV